MKFISIFVVFTLLFIVSVYADNKQIDLLTEKAVKELYSMIDDADSGPTVDAKKLNNIIEIYYSDKSISDIYMTTNVPGTAPIERTYPKHALLSNNIAEMHKIRNAISKRSITKLTQDSSDNSIHVSYDFLYSATVHLESETENVLKDIDFKTEGECDDTLNMINETLVIETSSCRAHTDYDL